MTQFLKVAYNEGIRRLDVVIDAKNLSEYAEKNKKGEISIIGIQLLENDVYQVQTKDAVKDLEGILYDFDKGYNVFESIKDLENIVSELKKKIDHHKSELPVPVKNEDLAECCNNAELEFSRVGSCFGYNIYACSECGASYDVEIIPDFSTKQKLN